MRPVALLDRIARQMNPLTLKARLQFFPISAEIVAEPLAALQREVGGSARETTRRSSQTLAKAA